LLGFAKSLGLCFDGLLFFVNFVAICGGCGAPAFAASSTFYVFVIDYEIQKILLYIYGFGDCNLRHCRYRNRRSQEAHQSQDHIRGEEKDQKKEVYQEEATQEQPKKEAHSRG